MIINPYVFNAPLLLDTYPNAAAAYSVRKLRTAYTGNCLRVRRSSDNAETDIGFNGNDVDTAAITTFVGANNGFVTSWYDQSGNANNLVQTTAANQMQIVSSGTILTLNGKTAVNASSGKKGYVSVNGFTFTQCYAACVFNRTGNFNSTDNLFLFDQTTYNQIYSNTNVNWLIFTGGFFRDVLIPLSTSQKLFSQNYNGTIYFFYDNGNFTYQTDGTVPANMTVNNGKLNLIINTIVNYNSLGNVQEFIFYTTNKTTDRAAIELEIKNFYGI